MKIKVPLITEVEPEQGLEPMPTAECGTCFALVLAAKLAAHMAAAHGGG